MHVRNISCNCFHSILSCALKSLLSDTIFFIYLFFFTVIWNLVFDHNLHVGWHLKYFLLLPPPSCLVSLVFLTYKFDCCYFLFIRFLDVELSLLLQLISRRWDLCFSCFFLCLNTFQFLDWFGLWNLLMNPKRLQIKAAHISFHWLHVDVECC